MKFNPGGRFPSRFPVLRKDYVPGDGRHPTHRGPFADGLEMKRQFTEQDIARQWITSARSSRANEELKVAPIWIRENAGREPSALT